jgi:uncharacterized membrane protein
MRNQKLSLSTWRSMIRRWGLIAVSVQVRIRNAYLAPLPVRNVTLVLLPRPARLDLQDSLFCWLWKCQWYQKAGLL